MSNTVKYTPRNLGMVHAVLWTGNAQCLADLPDFNRVVMAIKSITTHGQLTIAAREKGSVDADAVGQSRAYVVVNSLGELEVWERKYFEQQYEAVPIPGNATVTSWSKDSVLLHAEE
jgi:hypothetical protein